MACFGGARSFARAISGFSWAPGSARVGEGYQGSRKEAQRFEYSENSRAGFVEFAPKCHPTNQQFFDGLGCAPGVQRVDWKSSTTSQHNAGNHHMGRDITALALSKENRNIQCVIKSGHIPQRPHSVHTYCRGHLHFEMPQTRCDFARLPRGSRISF